MSAADQGCNQPAANTFHDVVAPNAGAFMSNRSDAQERSAARQRSFTAGDAFHV